MARCGVEYSRLYYEHLVGPIVDARWPGLARAAQDMTAQEEPVPHPLAERAFSGKFNLPVGEALHRRLAIDAAEEKLSINQLIIPRLNTAS